MAGATGLDAVTAFIESTAALQSAGIDTPLPQIVQHYIAQHKRDNESWTVTDLFKHLQQEGENPSDGSSPLRPRTIQTRRHYLEAFVRTYGERKVTAMTKADIEVFLKDRPNQRKYKENLQRLFNHAEQAMGCEYTNTVARYKRKRAKEVKPAEIATPIATRKLLHHLEKENKRTAIAMAIACFAGLRSEEIYRANDGLRWEWIDLDEGFIVIPANAAKTRDRREVAITDNLRLWLVKYWQETGRISPAKSRFMVAVRNAKQATGINWPNNAARHSCGTYYAKLHGYTAAADLLGHTGGTAMFKRHYSGITTKANAKKYFEIFPCE